MGQRILLLDLDYSQLEHLLTDWGEPAYRARQLWSSIYGRLAGDLQTVTSLPAALRDRLSRETSFDAVRPLSEALSSDGSTQKALLELPDGATIETVLMRYDRRRYTVCVSSQVGCAVRCSFCATGQGGLTRDLTTGEIVGQVLFWARRLAPHGGRISNVVVMGMGEPLANYDATWAAVVRLMDESGLNVGARHITLSTAGMVPGIHRLAAEDTQVRLAVSLHAPTDVLRDELVPLNRRYNLAQLMAACRAYQARTGRRVSFEYVLIERVNDSPTQARQLALLLRGLSAHINLIPLNPVPGLSYRASSSDRIAEFRDELSGCGVSHTLRRSRGAEIQAGCGQLRARQQAQAG